jgi:hypothetical protein
LDFFKDLSIHRDRQRKDILFYTRLWRVTKIQIEPTYLGRINGRWSNWAIPVRLFDLILYYRVSCQHNICVTLICQNSEAVACINRQLGSRRTGWPHSQYARRAFIVRSKVIVVTKNLLSQAPPCFGRHFKPLITAAFAMVSTHQSALGLRGGLWHVLFMCNP